MATRKNDFSDPIEVSEGGTGATTASGARTNLGITIGARTIEGTTDEIVVTNGNGVLGNPVVSIASNPVLPGSTAVTPPTGPTASQPGLPVEGMLRGNTDTGYAELYSNGNWFPAGRPITGTADQIGVTDGDSIAGDPTIFISDNAVFPGNEAITVPDGTTAERPVIATGGEIRFNTDTNRLEGYTDGAWSNLGNGGASIFHDNYLTGLEHSIPNTTDVTLSAGQCADSTNVLLARNSSPFTKSINANWAEGTGLGGFPSALTLSNNTVYYTFMIMKPDGNNDFGFDTSLTATNLLTDAGPSGYTLYRRIGSVRTQIGLTDLEVIRQDGDYFYYETQREDFTIAFAASGILNNVVALSAPNTIPIKIQLLANAWRTSNGGGEDSKVYVMPTTTTGVATTYRSHTKRSDNTTASGTGLYVIPTTDGTVRHYADIIGGSALGEANITTLGWHDRRGV